MLSRIHQFVDANISMMLYYALIFPYLSYCNIVWASNYSTRLKPLHILQKRIIRIIFHMPPTSSCKIQMANNNILNIYQINFFQTGIFMYKYDNFILPSSFDNMFVKLSDVHSYDLRPGRCFRTDFARTTLKTFSIKCSGPRIYSIIPISVSSLKRISLFKQALKSYLLLSHS